MFCHSNRKGTETPELQMYSYLWGISKNDGTNPTVAKIVPWGTVYLEHSGGKIGDVGKSHEDCKLRKWCGYNTGKTFLLPTSVFSENKVRQNGAKWASSLDGFSIASYRKILFLNGRAKKWTQSSRPPSMMFTLESCRAKLLEAEWLCVANVIPLLRHKGVASRL